MPVFDVSEMKFVTTDQYDVRTVGLQPNAIYLMTQKGSEISGSLR